LHDSKAIRVYCFKDPTDALLEEWFSLPDHERSRKFIGTADAAKIAHVTRQTIHLWLDSGELLALRVGKKLYVQADSLRARIRLQAREWTAGVPRRGTAT